MSADVRDDAATVRRCLSPFNDVPILAALARLEAAAARSEELEKKLLDGAACGESAEIRAWCFLTLAALVPDAQTEER